MPENVFINYNCTNCQVVQKLVNDNQILPDKSYWWTVQLLVPGCWITARWEWGEAAGCVWARSICCRGGSLRAVLGWAGFPVSEENQFLGAREPSGCSAPDADGRRGSVGSLPRCWGHQPSGQPRPSAAQAWKIRQRGRDQTFRACKWLSLGVWGTELSLFASGDHWTSHCTAEKGHLVCSLCQNASLSQRQHGGAGTANDRICRSRSQRSLSGSCNERHQGEQGQHSF